MAQDIEKIEKVMCAAPVIPVLIVEDPKKAVPMKSSAAFSQKTLAWRKRMCALSPARLIR